MSTLNNHPNVTAQGELFLPRARKSERRWDSDFAYTRYIEAKSNKVKIRPFSVLSYLDTFYRPPGIVGFKLMYKQLGLYPEIFAYLIRNRIHVIHLIRRNHLDVLVSYAIKAKLGQAHLLSGQSAPDTIQVTLDTGRLKKQMDKLQQKQRAARVFLSWSGLPHMNVAYEDLLRDPSNFNDIFEFLSVESKDLMSLSNLIKIRKGGHHEVISNYDEVKEVLVGSKFASLLE